MIFFNSKETGEIKLHRQDFINLFVIELFSDPDLSSWDIQDLMVPISGAHEHQLEENGKYSLFYLIGPESEKKMIKSYQTAVEKWTDRKAPPPFPDFTKPESRASIKELAMILEQTLKTGIQHGIKKINRPNLV